MINTIRQIHIASQYLAAAAISFLEKKPDDSHTNLGWDPINNRLMTHSIGNNQIGINLATANLEWFINGKLDASIDLQESTHREILNWFIEAVNRNGIEKDYIYDFHYDLPYDALDEENIFSFDKKEMMRYAVNLTKAQRSFNAFLIENKLTSAIRVWPHHFDLGFYTSLDDTGDLFMSGGLAMADTMVDELYFYAAGWIKGVAINSRTYTGLEKGEWRNDWDGAILRLGQADEMDVIQFLNQTKYRFTES